MSSSLRNYLNDTYEPRRSISPDHVVDFSYPIQIDDQDDHDKLDEFCNIFCIVHKNRKFCVELIGAFPITQSITDLIEIYGGFVNRAEGRLSLTLSTLQIEAIMDLADRIRKTSFMGETVNNSNWLSISSRTISSLYRFVRVIKEFNRIESGGGRGPVQDSSTSA